MQTLVAPPEAGTGAFVGIQPQPAPPEIGSVQSVPLDNPVTPSQWDTPQAVERMQAGNTWAAPKQSQVDISWPAPKTEILLPPQVAKPEAEALPIDSMRLAIRSLLTASKAATPGIPVEDFRREIQLLKANVPQRTITEPSSMTERNTSTATRRGRIAGALSWLLGRSY